MTEIAIFRFDDLHIIDAASRSVTIFATIGHDGPPCALRIPQHILSEMLNAWIDEKAGYCEKFNHPCGIGFVEIDIKQQGKWRDTDIPLVAGDPDYWRIEMEHG
jgi:hypothetical protein